MDKTDPGKGVWCTELGELSEHSFYKRGKMSTSSKSELVSNMSDVDPQVAVCEGGDMGERRVSSHQVVQIYHFFFNGLCTRKTFLERK